MLNLATLHETLTTHQGPFLILFISTKKEKRNAVRLRKPSTRHPANERPVLTGELEAVYLQHPVISLELTKPRGTGLTMCHHSAYGVVDRELFSRRLLAHSSRLVVARLLVIAKI